MRRLLAAFLFVSLAACGTVPRGGYYLDDGPGELPPLDAAKIRDAVPKREPLSAAGNDPYTALGTTYRPIRDVKGYRERGIASWYGRKFHGRPTSSREPYDMYAMTAAHRTLPLPSYVRVRNLQNGRAAVVRVNDRGPFLHNRLIDLSYAAAWRLGIVGSGTGIVEIETIDPEDTPLLTAASPPAAAPPRRPKLEIVASASADTRPPEPTPKLYLQVGAFAQRDNAEALRARLEQAAFTPVLLQPPAAAAGTPRLYRVRIGPVAGVEEGDRLTEQVRALGVSGAHIVVE